MKGQLRHPVLAGVLSAIVPGTGQMYNQEAVKAWIVILLFFLLAGTLIGSIGVWAFAVIDAFLTAGKINRGQKRLSVERNSGYALVSSIICGWGQIYNGQLTKGILMLFCLIVLAPTGIGFLIMLAYGAFDAYYTAEKINKGEAETPLIRNLIFHRLDNIYVLLKEKDCDGKRPEPVNNEVTAGLRQKMNLSLEKGDCFNALLHGKLALKSGGHNDTELHNQMGKIYLNTGNYGFSVLEFLQSFELGDRKAALYNNLGLAILNYIRNDRDKYYLSLAELSLEHALGKDSSCWQGDINFINLLIAKGDMDEARRRCNSLLERDSSLWQARHCLGLLSLSEGDREEARDIFLDIANNNPQALESRVALGRICEEERAEG
ncbi:MAG: hypothetical protein ABRQ39_32100, partial [Candidatus Eremiobacterota bacterium]